MDTSRRFNLALVDSRDHFGIGCERRKKQFENMTVVEQRLGSGYCLMWVTHGVVDVGLVLYQAGSSQTEQS